VSRLSQLKPSLRIQLDVNAYLRPVQVSDITEAYVEGLNNPVINKFLGQSRLRRQTVETVAAYIDENQRNPHDVLLGIFIENALRGTVRLHHVQEDASTAEFGVLIFDKNYWQQRWASRAVAAVVRFASREIGIRKFQASMIAQNEASRRTFAAAGFSHRAELDRTDDQNVPIEYWQLEIVNEKP
jgi:RimJ/RimL family protein N-acetyltransferase